MWIWAKNSENKIWSRFDCVFHLVTCTESLWRILIMDLTGNFLRHLLYEQCYRDLNIEDAVVFDSTADNTATPKSQYFCGEVIQKAGKKLTHSISFWVIINHLFMLAGGDAQDGARKCISLFICHKITKVSKEEKGLSPTTKALI